jgi:hypothetical protein
VDLQSVCDEVRDLRLLTVRGEVLRAVTGLATVSCGCALASRLAIRALYRLFVLLAFPSKFCSSSSIESITAIGVGRGGSYCSISSERSLSQSMSASVRSGSSCRSKAGHPSGPYRRQKALSEFTMSIMVEPDSSPNPSQAPSPASALANATGREAGFSVSSFKWFAVACSLSSGSELRCRLKFDSVSGTFLPSTVHRRL